MPLEPSGHLVQLLKPVLTEACEKARLARDRGGSLLCPRRRDPVHHPHGQILFGSRIREVKPVIVLVSVQAYAEEPQYRVRGAAGQKR